MDAFVICLCWLSLCLTGLEFSYLKCRRWKFLSEVLWNNILKYVQMNIHLLLLQVVFPFIVYN